MSGAIPSRSERKTLQLNTTSGQGAHVGPGAYYREQAGSPQPAPAPFHSSLDRLTSPASTSYTPGPGAYKGLGKSLDVVHQQIAVPMVSVFRSSTSRLYEDKSSKGKPGPGQYTEGNAWLKQSRYQAPPPGQRAAPSSARTATAPSIPARNQSYGYEDSGRGQLVRQQPTEPTTSGVGRDTVGPGRYELPPSLPAEPKAVAWGNSRTKRGVDYRTLAPGPGSYSTDRARKHGSGILVNINGVDVLFGGSGGTSSMVSKVPIATNLPLKKDTPGPGAYTTSLQPLRATPPPKERQHFGSRAVRSADPTRLLAAPTCYKTPGPGAYELGAGGVSLMQQCLTDPKPFNTTSGRFGRDSNGVPGPGEYRPDLTVSLGRDVAEKAAVGKLGPFGSAGARWTAREEKAAAELPGPGDYDAKVDLPKPMKRGADASFASASDRWRSHTASPTSPDRPERLVASAAADKKPVRGDPTALGPGKYTQPDPWASKGKASLSFSQPAFGSHSKRWNPSVQGGGKFQTPGPGRYDGGKDVNKMFQPVHLQAKEAVFGSQVSRFKTNGPFTPGPGQYASGHPDVMARKSFNITYQPSSGVAVR